MDISDFNFLDDFNFTEHKNLDFVFDELCVIVERFKKEKNIYIIGEYKNILLEKLMELKKRLQENILKIDTMNREINNF